MSDLPKKLRIKAGVINMGGRIAWGSETALMEEAADLIEQQQAEIERLKAAILQIGTAPTLGGAENALTYAESLCQQNQGR